MQTTLAERRVGWNGPGMDRHPSSSTISPSDDRSSGFAMNIGPVTPSSNTNNRNETPTWGPARPTPGASYIVSSMSSDRRRKASSKRSTAFAGVFSTGSPRVRIGMITSGPPFVLLRGAVPPRPSSPRRGPPVRGRHDRTRSRDPGRARASIPSGPRPTRPATVMCGTAPSAASRSADPATRKTAEPTGNPAAVRRSASSTRNRSGFPRTNAWIAVSLGWSACTIALPDGRAHATASIQVASARSRAAIPGRRSARSASRIATSSRLPSRGHAPTQDPPTRISAGRGRRARPRDATRRTGTGATDAAHSSTRSAPPRRIPKSVAPQCAHGPGASHTTHGHDTASDRSRPPQAAQAAGRPHERHTCADPVSGQRREDESSMRLPQRPDQPGCPTLGPARTTSTGGHRRVDGATVGMRSALASDEGHSADSTHVAPRAARAPTPHHARGSRAPGPRDAPDGSPATRRSIPGSPPGRTRPAAYLRPRRSVRRGSPAIAGTEIACPHRSRTRPAPRSLDDRRRGGRAPARPPAPARSRAAPLRDSSEPPPRPRTPRPRAPAEG